MIDRLKRNKKRVWLLAASLLFMFIGFHTLGYDLVGNLLHLLFVTIYYSYMIFFGDEIEPTTVKKFLISFFSIAGALLVLGYFFGYEAGSFLFFLGMFTSVGIAHLPYFYPEESE